MSIRRSFSRTTVTTFNAASDVIEETGHAGVNVVKTVSKASEAGYHVARGWNTRAEIWADTIELNSEKTRENAKLQATQELSANLYSLKKEAVERQLKHNKLMQDPEFAAAWEEVERQFQ